MWRSSLSIARHVTEKVKTRSSATTSFYADAGRLQLTRRTLSDASYSQFDVEHYQSSCVTDEEDFYLHCP
jgi:hypothetical protein